jgi:hypothetical protein
VPSRSEIYQLIAELNADIESLYRLKEQNEKAVGRVYAGATDELDYAALGYTIHNLYSLLENYALRIAKIFENELSERGWHRDLVHRMTLHIPETRPRVWSRELGRHIDELRRFRHAFRHIYDSPLDERKLMLAQEHVGPAVEGVEEAHNAFIEKLRQLTSELEE